MDKNTGRGIRAVLAALMCFFAVLPAAAEKIRVGYFLDNVFHMGQGDDRAKTGYGYEYYRMIASYTGWEYEYFYGSWAEVYNAFLEGKIDIIDDVSITEERRSLMKFSTLPMGEEHYYIFVPQTDSDISMSDVQTLRGKRIGVNRNSLNQVFLEKFVEENRIDCQIVLCDGVSDRLLRMKSRDIDAMVTTDGFTMDGYRPTFSLGTSPFYYAVQKDRPDLLEKLNQAMLRIYEANPNFSMHLRDKYFKKSILRTVLSGDEYDYIKTHPQIRVGFVKDIPPISCADPKTGEVSGLVSTLIDEFSRNVKSDFLPVAYDDVFTMVDALKNGDIDCAFPVIDDQWNSEVSGYCQTSAIIREPMALIYKDKFKGLKNYRKIGCTKEASSRSMYFTDSNAGQEYISFASDNDTILALQSGKVDCMVMNVVSWAHISKFNRKAKGLSFLILDADSGYSFAVSEKEPSLFSILESAISRLPPGMIIESMNRHSTVYGDYSLKSFIRYNEQLFGIFIVLFFLISIVGVIALERNRAHKDFLSFQAEHDALTGVYNRTVLQKYTKNQAGKRMCLAMIDIDDFKQVNDSHGHEMGDLVIKKVASSLTARTRASDKVIRYGGDEFMVLMEGAARNNGYSIHRIFTSLQESLSDNSDGTVKVSVSVGIAFSESGYSKELFDKADEALYKSKEAGKRKITVNDEIA